MTISMEIKLAKKEMSNWLAMILPTVAISECGRFCLRPLRHSQSDKDDKSNHLISINSSETKSCNSKIADGTYAIVLSLSSQHSSFSFS